MAQAVAAAASLAVAGDAVLLAPGCASKDMYPDYAARGRRLRRGGTRADPSILVREAGPANRRSSPGGDADPLGWGQSKPDVRTSALGAAGSEPCWTAR